MNQVPTTTVTLSGRVLSTALAICVATVIGAANRTVAQGPPRDGGRLLQLPELTTAPQFRDDVERTSCGERVTRTDSDSSWGATCTNASAPLVCREHLRAELAPRDGLEAVLQCGEFVLIADSQGRVLADLGVADGFFAAQAVAFVDGAPDPGVPLTLQAWIRTGGDAGFDLILAWDVRTAAFRYIFADYRVRDFTVRFDRPGAAEIETCSAVWRWNAERREYVVQERRRDAQRRCSGGDP